MRVAIIPARGGSKRIKNKNIKLFNGKPIIAWSIEEAKKTKLFSKVIVSTDSNKIRAISEHYGAEVPYIRDKKLSDDNTPVRYVINDVINYLDSQDLEITEICFIYATAPFIRKKNLIESYKKLVNNNLDFVFSAIEYDYPIQRSFKILNKNNLKMFFPKYFKARSQDLEKSYHDAAQFVWGKKKSFLSGKKIFSFNSMPFILSKYEVQDIDDLNDWKKAELLFKLIKK